MEGNHLYVWSATLGHDGMVDASVIASSVMTLIWDQLGIYLFFFFFLSTIPLLNYTVQRE